MPPKKHALSSATGNAQSKPPAKSRKVSDNGSVAGSFREKENDQSEKDTYQNEQETHQREHEEHAKDPEERAPYDYICMGQPWYDLESENNEKEKDQRLDEEQLEKKAKEMGTVTRKPAAEHPDHKWFCMWETWKLIWTYKKLASYTDPDLFSMYIYNDFHGYGLQECIENLLIAFNKELNSKKAKTDSSVKQSWAIMAALLHWLQLEDTMEWFGIDNGDRFIETVGTIGNAFVEMLNVLDLEGKLKADSDIKDVGLVMSLYLDFASPMEGYGVEEEDLVWRKHVIAYAKKGGIDLEKSGCHGTRELLQSYQKDGEIGVLEGAAKADRWKWKKAFRDFGKYGRTHGGLGGEKFNICKFTRQERAEHARDGKDPLADVKVQDLREGNIMFG